MEENLLENTSQGKGSQERKPQNTQRKPQQKPEKKPQEKSEQRPKQQQNPQQKKEQKPQQQREQKPQQQREQKPQQRRAQKPKQKVEQKQPEKDQPNQNQKPQQKSQQKQRQKPRPKQSEQHVSKQSEKSSQKHQEKRAETNVEQKTERKPQQKNYRQPQQRKPQQQSEKQQRRETKARKLILQAYNLSVGYENRGEQKTIQKGLRLKMFTGELVCLLGPNGAGKSTLLRSICGLQKQLSGDVKLDGKKLEDFSSQELAKTVSAVLTDNITIEHMKVYDLVAMGRYPYTGYFGRLSVLDHEIIEESIDLAGIQDLRDRMIDHLSDGERQKVMIARALAQETPFIILDEPMAFLDFPSKLELMQILQKLATEHNKAILMTTHDLNLSIQGADWIWLIGKDQRIKRGVPEDLVLKGDFAEFFKKDDISFDMHTGEFHIENHSGKKISVRGNGLHALWVRKALQRKGYQVINVKKGSEHILVTDNKELEIIVKRGEKEITVNSVKDMLLQIER